LGEEILRRAAALPTPTNELANGLDRSSPVSLTQSISESPASPVEPVSVDEVPIGIVDIPIGVCGSRHATSISNQPVRNEVFAEETSTVIVFPHGAVIRLSAAVAPGQMVMVANRKSAEVIPCRVVKAKNYPNVRGYAEIEFFRSTKGFWGPYVPQGTLKRTLGPLPVTSGSSGEDFWSANESSSAVVNPVNGLPATRVAVRNNKVASIQNVTIQKPLGQKLEQKVAKYIDSSEAELTTWEFPQTHSVSSQVVIDSSEPGWKQGQRQDGFARKPYWIRGLWSSLFERASTRAEANKVPSPRRKMIFACAIVVILLAIAGTRIFLLRNDSEQQAVTAEMNSQAEEPSGSALTNVVAGVQAQSNPSSAVPAMPVANTDNFPGNQNREYADSVRAFQTPLRAASVERKLPSRKPLAAPVITHHSNTLIGREAPPNISGLNSNTKANANPAAIAAFLPAGGRMKGPQLILRSMPNYPAIAKRAAIEGEVTVDAVIDTNGKLTNMKVVSGQPLLQQAALDSLRTWKYEPAYLDDKPVPVQTSITVKFRIH
jgi:TonB family protein